MCPAQHPAERQELSHGVSRLEGLESKPKWETFGCAQQRANWNEDVKTHGAMMHQAQ